MVNIRRGSRATSRSTIDTPRMTRPPLSTVFVGLNNGRPQWAGSIDRISEFEGNPESNDFDATQFVGSHIYRSWFHAMSSDHATYATNTNTLSVRGRVRRWSGQRANAMRAAFFAPRHPRDFALDPRPAAKGTIARKWFVSRYWPALVLLLAFGGTANGTQRQDLTHEAHVWVFRDANSYTHNSNASVGRASFLRGPPPERSAPSQHDSWHTYHNIKYQYRFSYPYEIVSERENVKVAESDVLSVRMDPLGVPSSSTSVCVAENASHWSPRQVFEHWLHNPPLKQMSEFLCGENPSERYVTVRQSHICIDGRNAYQVVVTRGNGERGTTKATCLYFAGRLAIGFCSPEYEEGSAAYKPHYSTYLKIMSSLRIQ